MLTRVNYEVNRIMSLCNLKPNKDCICYTWYLHSSKGGDCPTLTCKDLKDTLE